MSLSQESDDPEAMTKFLMGLGPGQTLTSSSFVLPTTAGYVQEGLNYFEGARSQLRSRMWWVWLCGVLDDNNGDLISTYMPHTAGMRTLMRRLMKEYP